MSELTQFDREILRANRPIGGYTDDDLAHINREISRLTRLRAAILREREANGERIRQSVEDALARAFGDKL